MNKPSHLFIDPLHKHSQEKDGGDRRGQVARDGLDVIKQLTALSCLDDGDPADADGYDAQNPDSGDEKKGRDRGKCGKFSGQLFMDFDHHIVKFVSISKIY